LAKGSRYVIIDAPSILGLRNSGVQNLPQALKQAGLMDRLNATFAGLVQPSMYYDPKRDPITLLLMVLLLRYFQKTFLK